ncbi:exostosin-1a-like [Hydractinia symbiolongicarpus]|uniref:exostosin-1a-like n=1 Tax=Hydractinia symbiolongicarpus TaxID=13093 RepID=UPI00254A5B65|nr:exostosin-1a-like [Hydractinia symbiolongicarpus]
MPPYRKRNVYPRAIAVGVVISFVFAFLFFILKLELWKKESLSVRKYGRRTQDYISKTTILRINNHIQQRDYYLQFQDFKKEPNLKYTQKKCETLKECFNFDKCLSGFYVYVYPLLENEFISPMYIKILQSIKSSQYYTNDPTKACIFILSLDTLDRDILSQNFVKHINKKISKLEYWNGGKNHLIFNLFSGTWPNYTDELSFDIGHAMIAKSSFSQETTRQHFDISFLLLPQNHPQRIINFINKTNQHNSLEKNVDIFPVKRKYLLAFKGKRYLYGIGSRSRNMLHVINNNKDIVLLTTCRHGKGWEKYKDDRCDEDNTNYDRYDYVDLLANSTFCLVPRGRRLGSFRFLEAMQYGCIPVLLSNGWQLPFEEVLDWSKFSLNINENMLLQLPDIIRGISDDEILAKKQQTRFIYHTYFASVEKITHTTLQVLRRRITSHMQQSYLVWNTSPGALNIDYRFSKSLLSFPSYYSIMHTKPVKKFTAVILAVSPVYRSSSPLFNLIKSINLSNYLDQILVIWLPNSNIPDKTKWPRTKVTLRVIHPPKKTMNARFISIGLLKKDLVNTDAVFMFDEDVVINTSEIDFVFSVWYSNPSRLVGFSPESHYMDASQEAPRWRYTSKQINQFSMIRTTCAIFHKYYSYLYTMKPRPGLHELVEREKTCESLAMNFLISKHTNQPPIKVAHSSQFKDGAHLKARLQTVFTPQQLLETKERCFGELIEIFDGLPLLHSKIAMNPVLYKDPVSISRKKYRTLE